MIIGAHVSTAGGILNAITNGQKIGAEVLQIFPSAPQRWDIRGWPDEDCEKFKTEWPKYFKEVIFHEIYLINLSGTPEITSKSIKAIIDTMILAEKIGVTKVVIHTGTYLPDKSLNISQLKEGINKILSETPKSTKLIFENSSGSTIGGKLEDLKTLLDISNDKERVGVCLDTCHAFAAGFEINTKSGYEEFMKKIESIIGIENVMCWHLNDSKFELGAKRDRHENIGEGKLGREAFDLIINDKRWMDIVGYLETPGFDGKGPDSKNVDYLKKIRL